MPSATRQPSLFLAHGSPMLVDDEIWVQQLHDWAQRLGKPKAILMLSAHWVDRPVTLGATSTVPLEYDFYGFPERYYQVRYPAPGAPELATRVEQLLKPLGPVARGERGLDHGAYVPLLAMYPHADVPVLQASLPSLEPKELLAMGRALEPLRDEGVLIMGSGFITHNLRQFNPRANASTPSWASEFDAWTAEALERRDIDALLDYQRVAPGVQQALPTVEHFVPLLVSVGAAGDSKRLEFPITGFTYGSFTKRSVELA
jgi:4,5-DOPA dioxygenase extradiol